MLVLVLEIQSFLGGVNVLVYRMMELHCIFDLVALDTPSFRLTVYLNIG